MRRLIIATAAISLMAAPAMARGMHGGGKGRGAQQQQTSEEKKQAAQKLERDYKAALDSIPDKKYDPWGNVRPAANAK